MSTELRPGDDRRGPGRGPRDHVEPGALEKLTADDCWALVRGQTVGRLAVNRRGDAPMVVPVNFAVEADQSSVVIRTGAGTKLNALSKGPVSLEIDDLDPVHRIGWSVLIQGLADWLYAEQDDCLVDTWAPGDHPYVVRIRPTRISGRRICSTQADTDGRGYR